MKYSIFIFAFICAALLILTSRSGSNAYFTDGATSANNTFLAASQFPTTPTPTPSTTVTPTVTVTPTPTLGIVVINEIMWMGSQGNSADEWVELRNTTSSAIDISNWTIQGLASGTPGTVTIPAGKSIPANGFFIISNDTEAGSIISVTPDYVVNTSLLNPGELLVLRDASSNTIDSANRAGAWYAGEDPSGQNPKKSMERNNTPGDGTVAGSWHTATTQVNIDAGKNELATPKAANSL